MLKLKVTDVTSNHTYSFDHSKLPRKYIRYCNIIYNSKKYHGGLYNPFNHNHNDEKMMLVTSNFNKYSHPPTAL